MLHLRDTLHRWIDRNILELGRERRLRHFPPLMVCVVADISGLTDSRYYVAYFNAPFPMSIALSIALSFAEPMAASLAMSVA